MRTRYFLIEPKYSDPDTYCSFTVGSDRVRASIQIYADMWMLSEVAAALVAPGLEEEWPRHPEFDDDAQYGLFFFYLTVLPHQGEKKQLRFRIFQEWLDDGAPYRADIRFDLTSEEAAEMSRDLMAWCSGPQFTFNWKAN
jgi:hypothetical protein